MFREAGLRERVKRYKSQLVALKEHLEKTPKDWGRFQSEFNQEIDSIFREIMLFEKEQLRKGQEEKIYKLKNLFIQKFRKDFLYGRHIQWSLNKPYGYAGDFQIIDDIYQSSPETQGIDRLFDNYSQMASIAIALRNRKEDMKRFLTKSIREFKENGFRVMNLASGPCREIKELDILNTMEKNDIEFDCFDQDEAAIQYATNLLGDKAKFVKFRRENAIRLALKKDIRELIPSQYHFIYSMGLFDYLDNRIAVRLVRNLKILLAAGGQMIIANMREKFQNPSVYFLEWVGDWNLIYRKEDEYRQIFLEAGFPKNKIDITSEQLGIIQYAVAKA